MPITYDNNFNSNEWFVLSFLTLGIIAILSLKKRFPIKEAMVYFLFSVFSGMVFDHTISIEPFDFYDVNDSSSYEIMDFLTYVMYGPFGYLYIYIFDYFKIKFSHIPIYVFIWALISFGMEFFAWNMGVYHYKNGYTIFYSLPIYLPVLVVPICLYKMFCKKRGDVSLSQ